MFASSLAYLGTYRAPFNAPHPAHRSRDPQACSPLPRVRSRYLILTRPDYRFGWASSGTKTFYLTYRVKGERRRRRGKLGRYELMSLKEARETRLVKARGRGTGHRSFYVKHRESVRSMLAVCGFRCLRRAIRIDHYVSPNSKSPENAVRILRNEFVAAWGSRDVRKITRADTLSVLYAIRDRGAPVAANRALARVRKFFNWLAEQDAHALIASKSVRGPQAASSKSGAGNAYYAITS